MRPGRFSRHRGRVGLTGRSIWPVLLLLAFICYRLFFVADRNAEFHFESSGPYLVERVVDGDTLLLEGGHRVRLIGVDTPESVAPDRPVELLGPEAAEYTRSRVQGRTVRLEFDRERRDRYERILAYVYVEDRMLNEDLIRAGYSRAETRFPFDSGMKGRFRRAEKEAREAKRGLWRLDTR